MLMPLPSQRLAASSDGADDGDMLTTTGLRWAFALQTDPTDTRLIAQTARQENRLLRYKMPQVTRDPYHAHPTLALQELLALPPFSSLDIQHFDIVHCSRPTTVVLPAHALHGNDVLEIIYVHVLLKTGLPFTGNDILKYLTPQELLAVCQSYRYSDYRRILKLFGLLD